MEKDKFNKTLIAEKNISRFSSIFAEKRQIPFIFLLLIIISMALDFCLLCSLYYDIIAHIFLY